MPGEMRPTQTTELRTPGLLEQRLLPRARRGEQLHVGTPQPVTAHDRSELLDVGPFVFRTSWPSSSYSIAVWHSS